MFKFNLEPVLALKEKFEDSKKRELGVATMHQEKIYQEKRVLEQKKEEILMQAKAQSSDLVDISEIRALNQYHSYMDQVIQIKGKELIEAEKKVNEKRNELLEAVKDRKILDNLKSIHREIFEEETRRDEQRIMDDMVTYRFGNRGRE